MGVDFDTCDTCGECVCDANLTYIDIPGYGTNTTCQVCVRAYFTSVDPIDDPQTCVEILNDAKNDDRITFYYAKWKDGENYSWDDVLEYTDEADITLHWISNPEGYVQEGVGRIAVGFYEGWEPKPPEPYLYDPDDGGLPLLEAADTFCRMIEKRDGIDIKQAWQADSLRPNALWKSKQIKKLDKEIMHLQSKRQKIESL